MKSVSNHLYCLGSIELLFLDNEKATRIWMFVKHSTEFCSTKAHMPYVNVQEIGIIIKKETLLCTLYLTIMLKRDFH